MSTELSPESEEPKPSPARPEREQALALFKDSWMSYLLLASFIACYAYELWLNYQLGIHNLKIDSRILVYLGANFPPAFAEGQYWRALSSCFLHADLLHLAMNGLALHYFGPIIERSFGPWRLLLAFLLTGVMGSLATTLIHMQDVYLSAGSSGGLYGLFGVLFVAGKRYRAGLNPAFQTWLNQNLGLLVIFSFVPSIDTWAHFGGLLSGMLLSLLYRPRPPAADDVVWVEDPEAGTDSARQGQI